MPPALPDESDAGSVGDGAPKKDDPADTPMKEEGEDEEDEEDDDVELYIVEAIHDHRSDFEDNQLRYQVKWKGYEKKSDRTWETEENLEGAREILQAYWEKLGGKPEPGDSKTAKKRGRQSTGAQKGTPDATAKRQRTSKAGRKSNGLMEQDVDAGNLIGLTDAGEDTWKPPVAKPGSWDPLIQSIDTVVRESSDGELWAYLIWNEKNGEGRFYRSKAKLPVVYKAAPQRMLHFYEKHLVFSTGNTEEAEKDTTTAT